MYMLRFLTAGESHGQGLVVILEGIPAGLILDFDAITNDLRRRQGGYGRGNRMKIESDRAKILSGVRAGQTIGGPISMFIENKDWINWESTMRVEAPDNNEPDEKSRSRPVVSKPRPGHADLAGSLKYARQDIRDILERASARETAARVAAGAIARQLLHHFGIEIISHVTGIGRLSLNDPLTVTFEKVQSLPSDSPLRCVDSELEKQMTSTIDKARAAGDTLGGTFEVIVQGVPVGLGSYVQWDRKLDGRFAQALMSIPAIKSVGIGRGPTVARLLGSQVHDEIVLSSTTKASVKQPLGISRPTNNAGGLEGGVSNGEEIRLSACMKPISTLMKPLRSVDLSTMTEAEATVERSDVCAVPAAAVVAEAVVCLVLADAFMEKFGGDSIAELSKHYENADSFAEVPPGRDESTN
jgi:chorismate synthase